MTKKGDLRVRAAVLLAIWCICGQGFQVTTSVAGETSTKASPPINSGRTPDDNRVSFRWAVRSPDVEGVRTDLVRRHAEVIPQMEPFKPSPDEREEYTDASFAPLMVVAGAVALSVVAEAVINFYRGYRLGGAIVDARGKDLEIRELPSLPAGSILVLAQDGSSILLETKSDLNATSLVKAIIPAAK